MSKIFYWMTDTRVPAGGEKESYEHVDILNDSGFDAYAFHMTGGRYTWFENRTQVVSGSAFWSMFNPAEDYLVLPETLGSLISGLPGRKVIFNKNLYLGCAVFDVNDPSPRYPYVDPSVVAVFAMSEHNCAHLKFAFPRSRIFRMSSGIDPALYRYRPLTEKKRLIVITKKGSAAASVAVVLALLRARALAGLSNLMDYELTFLSGMSNDDAAATLSDALMLISLSTHEGLPRTLLEAMSCGCILAACGSGPLKEILPPEYSFEPDDFVNMARHIEAVIGEFPDNGDAWSPTIARARATAARFSPELQRKSVIEAWREIADGVGMGRAGFEPID